MNENTKTITTTRHPHYKPEGETGESVNTCRERERPGVCVGNLARVVLLNFTHLFVFRWQIVKTLVCPYRGNKSVEKG